MFFPRPHYYIFLIVKILWSRAGRECVYFVKAPKLC